MTSCIFGLLALSNAHLNTLKLCKSKDSLSRMWPMFQLHGSVRIRPNFCLTGSGPCCVQRGVRASYLLLTNPRHFWHVRILTWPSQAVEQLKQSREKIPQYQHHCLFFFLLSLPVRQVINETSWTPWRQNTDRWKQLHNKEFLVLLDCSKENPKFTFQASTFWSFSSFWGLGSKTAQTSEVLALLLVNKPALKPFL